MRVGFGYDAHRYCEGRPFILGGVDFGFRLGLLGHSDADCLAHAIIDSILGALALGDIGSLFPDTNPMYEGISSMVLLESVKGLLSRENCRVVNIDSTVVCQEPKIMPNAINMRINIANALGLDISQVSVKATTEEGMGFTGGGEGIKCYAVCMAEKLDGEIVL